MPKRLLGAGDPLSLLNKKKEPMLIRRLVPRGKGGNGGSVEFCYSYVSLLSVATVATTRPEIRPRVGTPPSGEKEVVLCLDLHFTVISEEGDHDEEKSYCFCVVTIQSHNKNYFLLGN